MVVSVSEDVACEVVVVSADELLSLVDFELLLEAASELLSPQAVRHIVSITTAATIDKTFFILFTLLEKIISTNKYYNHNYM